MQDYPDFYVSEEGYSPDWSDGSEVLTAENGQPWVYRSYDKEQVTLTITHELLTKDAEHTLREFYDNYKSEKVRFFDPRTLQHYIVLMAGPPKLSAMRGGLHANIQMTLIGERE